MSDFLPDSRTRAGRGVVMIRGRAFVPVYCANCGCNQGLVGEEHTTFAFMLCDSCVAKHGPPACMLAVPDEVFWKKVRDEETELYGRTLTEPERARVLDDPESALSKLAKDAPKRGGL